VARIYEKCADKVEPNRADASISGLINVVAHGMYVLLTERWVFLAKLTKPYAEVNGVPIYLQTLAYAGVLTLPQIPLKWPQTAGIEQLEQDPLKILKKCST